MVLDNLQFLAYGPIIKYLGQDIGGLVGMVSALQLGYRGWCWIRDCVAARTQVVVYDWLVGCCQDIVGGVGQFVGVGKRTYVGWLTLFYRSGCPTNTFVIISFIHSYLFLFLPLAARPRCILAHNDTTQQKRKKNFFLGGARLTKYIFLNWGRGQTF